MTKFSVEPYTKAIADAKTMLMEHWQELAVHKDIPLDPDFGFYETAERIGILTVITARDDATNALIGYAAFIVRPGHIHYKRHKWAINDIVWVHPKHRNAGVGKSFVTYWDNELKNAGVDVVHIGTKTSNPALAFLLGACGYAKTGENYEKRL